MIFYDWQLKTKPVLSLNHSFCAEPVSAAAKRAFIMQKCGNKGGKQKIE